MRVRRLLVSLVATAVAAPAAAVVATTAPAAAATETRIVAGSGSSWIAPSSSQLQPGAVVHGSGLSLSVEVQTADGQQVYDGTLTVLRQLQGQSTWTTVAESQADSPYIYDFDAFKAASTATYKVVYTGSGDYAPTESSKAIKVQRNLNAAGVDEPRRFGLKGKVAPKWAKKKVVVQKKSGGKWRNYRTGRTDAKSRFFVPVAAPKRVGQKIPYRIVVAGGGGFVKSVSQTFEATRSY